MPATMRVTQRETRVLPKASSPACPAKLQEPGKDRRDPGASISPRRHGVVSVGNPTEGVVMSKLINSTTMTVERRDRRRRVVRRRRGAHPHRAPALPRGRGDGARPQDVRGSRGYWQTEEGEWADRLNPMPKFVASRTLEGPLEWNASLIEGDAAEGVRKLKDEHDGDLMLIGCWRARPPSARAGSGRRAQVLAASGRLRSGRATVRGRRAGSTRASGRDDVRHRCHASPLPACVVVCSPGACSREPWRWPRSRVHRAPPAAAPSNR